MADDRRLAILVVEDEFLIAMTLTDMIEDLGHDVARTAGSVERAVEVIRRHSGEIDGCILDVNLGGTSSAPVADALRDAGIPFLLASGYAGEQLARMGFAEVALEKPFRRDQLAAALERFPAPTASPRPPPASR